MRDLWVIEPYSGVGNVKFGMSAAEVADIIGPADDVSFTSAQPNDKTKFTEFRNIEKKTEPIIYYKNNIVTDFVFEKKKGNLYLKDYDLFGETHKNVIEKLTSISENVFESFAGYVFPDFGIYTPSAENFKFDKTIGIWTRQSVDSYIKDDIADGMGQFIKGGPPA